MDKFLQDHQASLDRQREEELIKWLFPDDDMPTQEEVDEYTLFD